MALEQGACLGVETLGRRALPLPELPHQRPATGRPGLVEPQQGRPAREPPTLRRRTEQAQGREGVVRRLAGPDQVPERVQDDLLVPSAGGLVEVAEERGAAPLQVLAQPPLQLPRHRVRGIRQEARSVPAEVERHPAVRRAQRAPAHPHDLAHGDQLVQQRGPVSGDPGAEDVPLDHRCWQRQPLQRKHHVEETVGRAKGGCRPPRGGRAKPFPRRTPLPPRLRADAVPGG